MALREVAERDMAYIAQGDPTGWRWSIELTDPLGNKSVDMYGLSNDVALFIDPGTGQPVSGRMASVAVRIAEIQAQGLVGFPEAIAETNRNPWIVKFNDINGVPYTFRVVSTEPDRALGLLVCILEIFKEAV
jgi:hypothetical protein